MTSNAIDPVSVDTKAPMGVRRLLDRADSPEQTSLRGHRRLFARPDRPHRARADLITVIEQSGLRGRGGAAFPTATKLRAVADGGRRPVVVVNGTEGEPASRKDAMLMQVRPHLVLDGAAQAAAAIGATEIFVCVERGNATCLRAIGRALEERRAEPEGASITVLATPPRYVAGEETALVHWINGGEAKPTNTPPRPYQRGVGGRPTLVNNVETLAHVAQVVQYGPDWFRAMGTDSEPGTTLTTVGGAVATSTVYEVPMGLKLADLVGAAGVTDGVAGVLLGGYFGSWLAPDVAATAYLCDETLRPLDASVGCGVVAILPTSGCGVVESGRVLSWMAAETAGQCGPCVNGLHAIATTFNKLARGAGHADDIALLGRWATQIEGRGACRFPDGAIRFLRSTLTVFGNDLAHHARGYPCAGARRPPILPIPRSVGGWR